MGECFLVCADLDLTPSTKNKSIVQHFCRIILRWHYKLLGWNYHRGSTCDSKFYDHIII